MKHRHRIHNLTHSHCFLIKANKTPQQHDRGMRAFDATSNTAGGPTVKMPRETRQGRDTHEQNSRSNATGRERVQTKFCKQHDREGTCMNIMPRATRQGWGRQEQNAASNAAGQGCTQSKRHEQRDRGDGRETPGATWPGEAQTRKNQKKNTAR